MSVFELYSNSDSHEIQTTINKWYVYQGELKQPKSVYDLR